MQTGLAMAREPQAHVAGFFIGMYETDRVSGEAWIWAPDARIALLSWRTGPALPLAEVSRLASGTRWGNFTVRLPMPLTTDQEAHEFLSVLLPELHRRWTAWRVAVGLPQHGGRMSDAEDRDPEFSRYEAAWANFKMVRATSLASDVHDPLTPHLQAQSEPMDPELQGAAVELAAARAAFLTLDTDPGEPTN